MTLTLFTVRLFNSLSYLNNQIVFIYSCPYIFIIHSICFLSPVTLIYFQSIIIPVPLFYSSLEHFLQMFQIKSPPQGLNDMIPFIFNLLNI